MKHSHQLDYLFDPKTVAVIGASNSFGKWGFDMTMSVANSPRKRNIYPINSSASEVLGLKAYPNVKDVPGPVDLAVITVPPEIVPSVMQDCADKGVKTALIASAGLSETGDDGAKLEAKIVDIAQSGGIRFIGPNSMGHFNMADGLFTTPWLPEMKKGSVSIISQSGNCGVYSLYLGAEMGIGFNKFISSGNEADLRMEDYLEYLAQDDETKVILAYIEGLRDGRRFLELAKEITQTKPIIILKAGKTVAGKKATMSHTASLSGSEVIHNAAFKQAGVIVVEEIDEMIDVAGAVLRQPLPRSNRVGILTAGGGFGVLATDACEKMGVEICDLSTSTIDRISEILPSRWSHGNPIDTVAAYLATFPCLWALMEDENVDSILLSGVIGTAAVIPKLNGVPQETIDLVQQLVKMREVEDEKCWDEALQRMEESKKPIILLAMAPEEMKHTSLYRKLSDNGMMMYPSPMRAARALAHLVEYSEYLRASTNGSSKKGLKDEHSRASSHKRKRGGNTHH